MADISKIVTLDGSEYNIKDATARTVMTGATSSIAGTSGLVPAPTTSDTTKFLRGDGTWADSGQSITVATNAQIDALFGK